ncbi:MAG: hypothetical protein F4X84_01090 [Synechococcus sp. SB0662_bin_45]|nr:hypothetical protein [Synechococcus sp. SB0668_bin_13]MYE20999.1 hypothetical protein [Synechococcus sp. SB0662_bin_45]
MNLLSHNPLCHNTDTIALVRSDLESMLGKQLVCEKLVTDNGVVQPAAVTSASAQDMPYAPISSVWEGSDAELLEGMCLEGGGN